MPYAISIEASPAVAAVAIRAGGQGRRLASHSLGLDLPGAGEVVSAAGRTAFAMAADEWLVTCPDRDAEAALYHVLDEVLGGRHGAVARVGAGYSRITLSGAGALDVMAQLVPEDLAGDACAVGHAWRGAFGRASALVHRTGPACFEVFCDNTLHRYAMTLVRRVAGIEAPPA